MTPGDELGKVIYDQRTTLKVMAAVSQLFYVLPQEAIVEGLGGYHWLR